MGMFNRAVEFLNFRPATFPAIHRSAAPPTWPPTSISYASALQWFMQRFHRSNHKLQGSALGARGSKMLALFTAFAKKVDVNRKGF